MQVIVEENYDALAEKAAEIISQAIKEKPDIVLGLATGSTALGVYNSLVNKKTDFSKVTTFNLDEYAGLPIDNKESYHYYMKENLFSKVNIKDAFFPDEFSPDYNRFEEKIKQVGGIDLQILGIGRNGHIGFNEPGSSFDSRTREIVLDAVTIKDNARFFDSEAGVPKKAITMGLATIMDAKKIILLASGRNKKDIVTKLLQGPITEQVPASILQKHNNVIIILDKEAYEDIC